MPSSSTSSGGPDLSANAGPYTAHSPRYTLGDVCDAIESEGAICVLLRSGFLHVLTGIGPTLWHVVCAGADLDGIVALLVLAKAEEILTSVVSELPAALPRSAGRALRHNGGPAAAGSGQAQAPFEYRSPDHGFRDP